MTDETPRRYTLIVAENFHYMDEEERYTAGEFDTYQAAVAECRAIVDASLHEQYRPGMTAVELFALYTVFGDDPYVVPVDGDAPFSAWTYASQRCEEICARNTPPF